MSENEKIEESFVTPYRIAKMLKERGVERKPQQMYRYVAQNLIKSEIVNDQRVVRESDAIAFVEKFVAKHKKVSLEKK